MTGMKTRYDGDGDHYLAMRARDNSSNYVPITLVCVDNIINGVPFGAQIAWLSMSSTGIPPAVTRRAAVTHCAVTQGLGAPDTLKGQPATV
jgi:hypothetical protein